MFKKQFKISNSHSLAGKDKKKLKETLLKQNFDPASVDTYLDDKKFEGGQELILDKLQGSKTHLLSRGKTPLMFGMEGKQGSTLYLPTIYLLFQLEKLPALKIYLKEGVEQYIFNGADLMWPGIKSLNTEDFRQYDVAVIYAKNEKSSGEDVTYAPIAVGKILTGKIPEQLKGKAVQVEHYLYDELWNLGPKKIPDEIKLTKVEGDFVEPAEKEPQKEDPKVVLDKAYEESDDQEDDSQQQPVEEEKKESELAADEQKGSSVTIEDDTKVQVEEMDPRIVEAFYRSLMESVLDTDLPMEPSDFQKDHLMLYSDKDYKLDFRLSSFRRVGKLLEIMHKKGVIDYSEIKGVSHKLLYKVYRGNEEFKSYQPKYSLKKGKKAVGPPQEGGVASTFGAEGDNYPRVQVEEIYEPTKHLNAIIGKVKGHQLHTYYSIKECRDLVQQYVKEAELDLRKGMIKVDPMLAQILNHNLMNKDNEVPKDVLLKIIPNYVKECYQVIRLDEDEIIKSRVKQFKGPVPHVIIKAQKVSNKKQTVISGLELFQIDYDELVPFLSHKCAGSATLHEVSEGTKKDHHTVQVQGEHLDSIVEILTKKYKVPIKYINTINNINSKKKKN